MALSGIEWHAMSVFDVELRTLKMKPRELRSDSEQIVVDYLKTRIAELEEKKKSR